MVKDAAPGLFMGDLKRVWDRLKALSPLRETVNPRKRIICKRFLVFEKEYSLKVAPPNLGGLRKAKI
jgi:hypothetical protein